MTTDPGATAPPSGPEPTPSRHGRLIAVVVALVVTAVVVALVLVARGTDSGGPSGAQATTPAATSSTSTSPSATSTPSPPTTTSAAPSAYDQLGPFFAAARRMDEQLHTAAANINAAGPPWYVLDEKVASSVRAADEKKVLVTIPGGMPPELLRQVVMVYSELVSRRAAMTGFQTAHGFESIPPGVESTSSTESLLAQLKHGAEAAVRFEGDLSAARATARSLPPFTKAAFGSRADMEIALLANYVHKANYGCGQTGGAIVRTPPPIRWTSSSTGRIDGLDFMIKLEPDGHYTDDPILAC
jgi:hypothetical protein